MKSFCHTGDLGDIIYSLLAVKRILSFQNEKGLFLVNTSLKSIAQPKPLGEIRGAMLCELLETQSYIATAKINKAKSPTDYDLSAFRVHLRLGRHLALSHWLAVGLPLHLFNLKEKWFDIPPIKTKPIIITRTLRRRNDFDWRILKPYKDKCLFVGLKEEWAKFPVEVEYHPVSNLIEYASIISGARLVMANQTFTFALAEAMKKPRFLEVARSPRARNCLPAPDSLGYCSIDAELIERCIESESVF